jgi:2-C-methyl-D-erythritol 4-phosphate cytidylyltransferase
MKLVENDVVRETLPREHVWRAQTPQGFRTSVLREAHDRARREGFEGTDDASLVERLGIHPVVVAGDHTNIKITTREDLEFAEAIMRARR